MIFLVLFVLAICGLVYLVRWVLVTSGKREDRLVGITEKLTEKLGVVEETKDAVQRIERRLDAM